MTLAEIMMWKESLASCAIEGNEWARSLLDLQKDDPDAFYAQLTRMNENHKKEHQND